MSALMLSVECGGGLAYHPVLGPLVSVKRCEDCPGGETRPGLIGGWSCSCECHRTPQPKADDQKRRMWLEDPDATALRGRRDKQPKRRELPEQKPTYQQDDATSPSTGSQKETP